MLWLNFSLKAISDPLWSCFDETLSSNIFKSGRGGNQLIIKSSVNGVARVVRVASATCTVKIQKKAPHPSVVAFDAKTKYLGWALMLGMFLQAAAFSKTGDVARARRSPACFIEQWQYVVEDMWHRLNISQPRQEKEEELCWLAARQ